MVYRFGNRVKKTLAPLLLALIFGGAAAAPPSYETVFREARAASERGESAAAVAMLDEALARAGSSDDEAVWALRIQRAYHFTVARNYAAVSKLLDRFPPKLSKSKVAVRRLIVQAMGLYWTDKKKEALDLLTKARDIAAAHAPSVTAEVLYRRVAFTNDLRDGLEAIRLAKKAGDQVTLAKAEAAVVMAYGRREQYSEAANQGEALLPRLDKLQLFTTRKTHLGNLGWIYSELGDYERAAELLTRSLAEAERLGDANQKLQWSTTISNVFLNRRDWNKAVAHCEAVIAGTTDKPHPARAGAFVTVARAYLELGRLADARRAIREARALQGEAEDELLTRVTEARIDRAEGNHDAATKLLLGVLDKTAKPTTRLAAQGQLAQVYAATRRNEQAEKAFERAVGHVRTARASIGDQDLRLFFFNTTSELYDDYVDFLVGSRRPDDALRVTDTIRARTLAEDLDVPPAASVDVRKVAQQRQAVILCYWLGRRQSYLWTITAAGVKLTTLAKNDLEIERAVELYRNQLLTTAGTLARTGAAGKALFNLLVAPAAPSIPLGSRVIVIPDGKLHLLNFETLVVPAQPARYWIEDVTVANASSLQLLARGAAAPSAAPRMLVIGNPPVVTAAFPALKQAGDEIARVQKQFPGRATVLAGPRATPAAYLAAKPESFDFVHFVAHGDASRTRPLDSAVILGPDKDQKYRLVARDIRGRSLKANLVTISSCHSAGSATYAGEGVVGLAWAFLNAGAQQVVAALWAVNDTAAPGVMEDMYAGIQARKDPAVALRDAKLRLMRAPGPHKHAMFWAPFVVYL